MTAGTSHQLWSLGLVKSSEDAVNTRTEHRSYDFLWKEYFRDPWQWWDNRNSKVRHAYPDFKHKVTKESLWIDGWRNPPWVDPELRRRGLDTHTRKSCKNNKKVIQENTLLSNGEGTAFVTLLKDCTRNKDLYAGIRIHDDILKRGLLEQCSDSLVTMYAKCGSLAKAKELLGVYECRNVSSWNSVIAGYVRQGQHRDSLECFEQMQHKGLSPNAVTFACVLKACGSTKAAEKGEQIHYEIARQGLLGNDVVLGTALIDMYAKCGALAKARRVLEELPSRNVVSWSVLIAGYAQQGQGEQALKCFQRMQLEGFSPDSVTFICVLKACGTVGAIDQGEQIHDEIAKQGLLRNNFMLGTALLDMYAKCGALAKARRVLEELPFRDVASWNALIAGYIQQGQGEQALNCFERMQCEGIFPDAVTFNCILKACGSIGGADKGKQIHEEITRQGLLGNNILLGTALIDMYVKCGDLAKAARALEELPSRTVVSWNLLIAGYVQQGLGEQALNCFEWMQVEGLSPDAVTFGCILKACGSIKADKKGKRIHDEIVRQGLLGRNIVLGNAVVDMYAKCGALAKARRVLEELPSRDVVSWSALIAGYAEQGQGEQALNCFERMRHEGILPNAVTFACILKACGAIGATDKGEQIHDEIARQGLLGNDIVLGNALVDMYAKCGALSKAQQVLQGLPFRDVSSWNALIAGYAQQGQGEQALNCLERMEQEGLPPDAATFSCMLNSCSHLGLMEDCHMYFVTMSSRYGVKPDIEHYTCMIDLFGRAGHLEKAVEVIQEMPSSDSSAVWRVLLGACQRWGDGNVGRWAFNQAIRGDQSDGSAYVLMANIYAAAGVQEDAKNIKAMGMENTAWRKPGGS